METDIVADIAKAINGEYSAITCYGQLAKMAPNESAKNRILEIRSDEIRHYNSFSQIYAYLTGRQPAPRMSEECARRYGPGLRASFMDEQETVDFYLDIADKTNDPHISATFRRAAADEQNHAVWFLYLMGA